MTEPKTQKGKRFRREQAIAGIQKEMENCLSREADDVVRLKQYWSGCVAGLKTALVILQKEGK